jgi:hypothetical protein
MKNFDLFESYKSNTRYPLIAELKIVNSEPVFTYDKYGLFGNPHLEEWKLTLSWKPRFVDLEYGFLHGVFFMNGVLIEEHHLSLPPLKAENQFFWWGHNHLQRLLKGLNAKFYGR